MIQFKRTLSILSASILLTVASCSPNDGFTVIYESAVNGGDLVVEINNEACQLRIIKPEFNITFNCLSYREYESIKFNFPGFEIESGPAIVFAFPPFSEITFNNSNINVYYLPDNKEAFPNSNLKTTNWYLSF